MFAFQAVVTDQAPASAQTVTHTRNEGQARGKTQRETEQEANPRRGKREIEATKRKEKSEFSIYNNTFIKDK